ncbi:tripartite tricarboxylate transporter TctB family protein [Devosia sp. A449]
MKIVSLDRAFAGLLVLLGLHVVMTSLGLGLYRNNVPGPGLFPLLAGTLVLGLAITILVRSFVQPGRNIGGVIAPIVLGIIALSTLSIVAFVFVAPLLGLSIAAFLLMVVIGLLTQEAERRDRAFYIRLVLASAATAVICHVLFGQVIRLPLIYGPFGF